MKKPPKDINQFGKFIVDTVTDKNPSAVVLGRMGGKARAKSLTKAQKSEIAKKAAHARWGKDSNK